MDWTAFSSRNLRWVFLVVPPEEAGPGWPHDQLWRGSTWQLIGLEISGTGREFLFSVTWRKGLGNHCRPVDESLFKGSQDLFSFWKFRQDAQNCSCTCLNQQNSKTELLNHGPQDHDLPAKWVWQVCVWFGSVGPSLSVFTSQQLFWRLLSR